jgi:hypothetical protein
MVANLEIEIALDSPPSIVFVPVTPGYDYVQVPGYSEPSGAANDP